MKKQDLLIEEKLKGKIIKPSRSLSQDFTENVLTGIENNKQSTWQKIGQHLHLNHMSKAAFASLAGIFITGSTVAAFMLWPNPTVTPTLTQQLPSGNRIVGVSSKDCSLNTSPQNSTDSSHDSFYEIRQESSLTDDEVFKGLQASCEDNLSNEVMNDIKKRSLPGNIPGLFSTPTVKITQISKDSFTVVAEDVYTNGRDATFTFTKFSKSLIVQDRQNKSSYGQLKVGDSVKMFLQDTNDNIEGTPGYDPLSDTTKITVLAILRIPALTGDPSVIEIAFAVDIVRVERCSTSPTGFCRAYEFAPNTED